MANKILLKHKGDVNDFYEPSDSEGEYTEREKKLLQKARKGRQRNVDAEQEILAFNQQDDDDDEDDEQGKLIFGHFCIKSGGNKKIFFQNMDLTTMILETT